MWLVLRFVAIALVASGLGCRPAAPPDPPAVAPVDPAEAFAAARHLPASTAIFVGARRLDALFEASPIDALRRAFPADVERMAFAIARRTGLTPLEPSSLADLGVALDGPAGMALPRWRHFEALRPVFFLTLADPARFKAALYRALAPAGARLVVIEDAVTLQIDGLSIVLRDDVALVVPDGDAALVERLATQPAATSLAHRPGFRASLAAVAGEGPLLGYVDPRGILFSEAGLDPRFGGADRAAARRDLDAQHAAALTRARGERAAVIARIDREFRDARAALGEGEAGDGLRALVGTIEGAGLAIDPGPRGASLQAEVLMAEDAPLRRLLGAGRACEAGTDGAALAFDLHLDVAVAEALVAQGFGAEVAGLLGGVGLGLDAFDGDVCLRLGLPAGGLAAVGDPTDLSIALRVGLRDPAAVRAAFTRLGQLPGAPPVYVAAGGFTLAVGDREVRVAIEDRALVAETAPAALGRAPAPRSPVWALLDGPAPRALAVGLEIALPLLETSRWDYAEAAVAWDHEPEIAESAAYQAKRREVEAARAAVDEALRAASRRIARERAGDLAALGVAALVVRRSGAGARIEARWMVRGPGIVGVIAELVDRPRADPWDDPALIPLLERRSQLERELEALHDQLLAERSDREAGDGAEDAPSPAVED